MTDHKQTWIGLDIGERRIGVAVGDGAIRLASPLTTLDVDGLEVVRLQRTMYEHDVTGLVVGLPRNMSGAETKQTAAVKDYVVRKLSSLNVPVRFQDESLTSVAAEKELSSRGRPYTKGDVDALAATLILQDYLEAHHGH